MGWTEIHDTPHKTRAEMLREELSQAATPDNPRAWGFEYMTERGATVYAIAWHDPETGPRRYFGMVCLTTRRAGFFGYKEITEDAHPYHYDAPLKMLDMLDRLAPEPREQAAQWRQRCRENLKRKAAKTKAAPGLKVNYGGRTYTLLTPVGPRKGWQVEQDGTGDYYRMNARQVSEALRAAA